MHIEQLSINLLIPYEFNNKKHEQKQIDRLANSIKEFGFNQPLVIDENNIILVGHGRLLAAQKLGLTEVPVLTKSGLTELQKKAYRILDNKLSDDADWDYNNLELEIGNLEDEGFPIEEWGLDEFALEHGLNQPEAVEDDFDSTPPKESFLKLGDLLELGRHRVLCGDCTKPEELEKLIQSATIDLVLTDPPYGVSYVGKTKDALVIENDSLDDESLKDLWSDCINSFLPKLKEGGVIYASVPAGRLFGIFYNQMSERGLLHQQLVWDKGQLVMGHSDYQYQHEPILYGWKEGAAHYFISDRSKTDVLLHKKPSANKEHPTMKPISLWAELIGNSSRLKENCFDPFLGSGTTLIACEQLNRTCFGMEISPNYCEVILNRYVKYCQDNKRPIEIKINGEGFDSSKYQEAQQIN